MKPEIGIKLKVQEPENLQSVASLEVVVLVEAVVKGISLEIEAEFGLKERRKNGNECYFGSGLPAYQIDLFRQGLDSFQFFITSPLTDSDSESWIKATNVPRRVALLLKRIIHKDRLALEVLEAPTLV